MSPSLFQIEGECDMRGNVYMDRDGKSSNEYQKAIQKQVKKELWKFQVFGICKILVGIAINVLWIAMLLFLHSNIEYSPNV